MRWHSFWTSYKTSLTMSLNYQFVSRLTGMFNASPPICARLFNAKPQAVSQFKQNPNSFTSYLLKSIVNIVMQPQAPKHCKYFLPKKSRYCKFQVAAGSDYCKAHDENNSDRIPCPYQTGTYVIASQLEKHLEICPKLKEQRMREGSQWYEKEVNKVIEDKQPKDQAIKQEINIKMLLGHKDKEFLEFLGKIPHVFFKAFEKDPKGPLYYIDLVEKDFDLLPENVHSLQGTLLTSLLGQYKLLSPDYVYVEFGAGRGLLSYTIANQLKKLIPDAFSKHILLEREARRNKYDKYMKDNPYFQRFRGDVEDFNLGDAKGIMLGQLKVRKQQLKQLKDIDLTIGQKQIQQVKGLVGVCKHMCGMATDLSIKALLKASKAFSIKGTVMATCCHQLCSSNSFGNLKFFQELGLSDKQTEWMFRVSSWGTRHVPCTLFTSQSTPADVCKLTDSALSGNLSDEEKEFLGKMCKRLIDLARTQLLGDLGLKVEMIRYCSRQTSPENFAIVSY